VRVRDPSLKRTSRRWFDLSALFLSPEFNLPSKRDRVGVVPCEGSCLAGGFVDCAGTWFAGSNCVNDNLRGIGREPWSRGGRLACQPYSSKIMPTIVTNSRILPEMMTRIGGNSGKRNGKPFRMNAGAADFYVILHCCCRCRLPQFQQSRGNRFERSLRSFRRGWPIPLPTTDDRSFIY
jgi:hypothetical protein